MPAEIAPMPTEHCFTYISELMLGHLFTPPYDYMWAGLGHNCSIDFSPNETLEGGGKVCIRLVRLHGHIHNCLV